MAARLGMYMNARRGFENTAPLDANAVTNIEQLLGLRDTGRLAGIDVLVRLSRDQLEHRRQTPDGLDAVSEVHWLGTREFDLGDIAGPLLTGPVGRALIGGVGRMLTTPALADFLKKLQRGKKSDARVLLLWGHADGPRGVLFAHSPGSDTEVAETASRLLPQDILSPSDLERALEESMTGRPLLDFVCFDACQGACIEFASILAGYSRYLISSQTPVPGAGWNYGSWPALLSGITGGNHQQVATAIADDFAALNALNSSISVIDLSRANGVLKALKAVTTALLSSPTLGTELTRVRQRIPTLDQNKGGTVDLVTLFETAATAMAGASPEFAEQCAALAKAAGAAVVDSRMSADLSGRVPLRGYSIYFPTPESGYGEPWDSITDNVYFTNPQQLRKFKRTGWHRFVATLKAHPKIPG